MTNSPPLRLPAKAPTPSVRRGRQLQREGRGRARTSRTRRPDKPINEPTERSIPPLTITGVKAIDSKPISTLSRSTSKALSRVRKVGADRREDDDLQRQEPQQDALRGVEPDLVPAGSGSG